MRNLQLAVCSMISLWIACGDSNSVVCLTDKIQFTRETGCQNDGSVEFCIPQADGNLLDRLKRIDPEIGCSIGGGRAQCDIATELLCSYPTRQDKCLAYHGALTDSAWEDICRISALAEITEIVHTFYE